VQCLESGIGLGMGEPWKGQSQQWQAFSMEFDIPQDRCPAQWLLLKLPAQTPSERQISGSLWFDGLKIQRIQKLTERKPN